MHCLHILPSQLDDSVQIGTLVPSGSPDVSVTLEGRGLKGGGKIKNTTSLHNNQFLQQ